MPTRTLAARLPILVGAPLVAVLTLVATLGLASSPASAASAAGALDRATHGPNGVYVEGWSVFREVHLYIDGRLVRGLQATRSRPDVAAALGTRSNTGFALTIPYSAPGTHTLCAYGIDPSGRGNPLLDCVTFHVGTPFGSLDIAARAAPGSTTVNLVGWTSATEVHVYVNGRGVGVARPGLHRPDVRATLGFLNSGFAFSAQIRGAATVCAYAIGITNPLIGCRGVGSESVPPASSESLRLLNQLRAQVGAPPVTLDPGLSSFAHGWSQTMAASGLRHSGGPYAENIGWWSVAGASPEAAAQRMHALWSGSSGHYRNMTNPNYTRVGIGFHVAGNGWWATHVFQ